MKLSEIKTPITVLQGIGPAAAKLFAKLNIFTISDLLMFFPKNYEDRTKRIPLKDFNNYSKINDIVQVIGHQWIGYGKMKTLKIIITDGTISASLIAFNRPFLQKSLPVGSIISVNGSFFVKYGEIQSSSFETSLIKENDNLEKYKNYPIPDSGIIPVYPLTEGIKQKNIRKTIHQALEQYLHGIENDIPEEFINKRNILPKAKALKFIHSPSCIEEIEKARYSLIYEELFNFQSVIAQRAFKHKGFIPTIQIEQEENTETVHSNIDKDIFYNSLSPLQKQLYDRLSFTLTNDQCAVISQMNNDIDNGYKQRCQILESKINKTNPFTMARLLQGDVGSGKTLVALFACLRIINWKGQCAFMAPTEILAKQHAETAALLLGPLGINIAFLSGNVKYAGRTQLLKSLKDGTIDLVIGTHALFSKQVEYNDLQLAIIDEQHRFGVIQRQLIIEKGKKSTTNDFIFEPHLLMMSATPIPQTLALTVFGDLDVSVIKTMPQGRKPIITYLVKEGNEHNAYNAVKKQLQQGKQAYFVYPAIESDNIKNQLKSAEEMFDILSKEVFPEYKCALLHSKIEEEEQSKILKDFKNNKINILAATTVIEVGVDVPNTTCIVIEQADRFGLAQLHQLRGRVGRGKDQGYCFLIYSNKITQIGIERMKVLRQSTDGFYISNQDLKLRGPGEITGTIQAGNLTLGIADLVRDSDILKIARTDAFLFMQQNIQGI